MTKKEETFFEFAAEVGLTKHLGGIGATDKLIKLCHIGPESYLLDVGCGVGQTACYIAKKTGCRVMGVDIVPKMVSRSQERAKKEKLTHLVSFKTADAQDLPFADGTFDAVITESVTAFPEDKQKAVNEYARVTRPGGFIGLNESTWLQMPPPPEMITWVQRDIGHQVQPLPADAWSALMENAGLKDVTSFITQIDTAEESKGIAARYGIGGILRVLMRTFGLYRRNENYRAFVKEVRQTGIIPDNFSEYFGYGIYIGRK